MDEQSPTPEPEPTVAPLTIARVHLSKGHQYLADFEARPADVRQVELAGAHFAAAGAIAGIELAAALRQVADRLAVRTEV